MVVTVFQSERFFSSVDILLSTHWPQPPFTTFFPTFPVLLHLEGQWINMCRYCTAQRVMNWHYSGSLKTPSSRRSCVCLYRKLSLCFGLRYVTWTIQGAGIMLTTTHDCPFPLMLPNNRITLHLHTTLLLQRTWRATEILTCWRAAWLFREDMVPWRLEETAGDFLLLHPFWAILIKGTQKAATWIALNIQLHAAEERELEKHKWREKRPQRTRSSCSKKIERKKFSTSSRMPHSSCKTNAFTHKRDRKTGPHCLLG